MKALRDMLQEIHEGLGPEIDHIPPIQKSILLSGPYIATEVFQVPDYRALENTIVQFNPNDAPLPPLRLHGPTHSL